jgi:hypothetical protein
MEHKWAVIIQSPLSNRVKLDAGSEFGVEALLTAATSVTGECLITCPVRFEIHAASKRH